MKLARITLLIALLGLTAMPALADLGDWQWVNPSPSGHTLNDVVILDGGTAVAVGEAGAVVRSVDGGLTWSLTYVPEAVGSLWSVGFSSATHGFAGGDGWIFRTSDGGVNWEALYTGISGSMLDIKFTDDNTAWVAFSAYPSGGIMQTTDGGDTWNVMASVQYVGMRGVQIVSPTVGYAVGDYGTLLKTTDGGTTWLPLDLGLTNTLYDVHFFDENTGLIAGSGGLILRTEDGGTSWSSPVSHTTATLQDMNFTDALNGSIVGRDVDIITTSDGGLTWSMPITDPAERIYAADFAANGTGLAVGNWGNILRTEDNWTTWTDVCGGPYQDLLDMDFLDDNTGVAVGDEGVVLRTTDGGASWDQLDAGITVDLKGISFGSTQVGLMVGMQGKIYRTTDAGLTWLPMTGQTTWEMRDVQMYDENLAVAVGGLGAIERSTDGGVTWYNCASGVSSFLNRVIFLNSTTVLAIGDNGVILRSTNAGLNWSPVASGTNNALVAVDFYDENIGMIAGHPDALRTDDGGLTWTWLDSGYNYFYALEFVTPDLVVIMGDGSHMIYTTDRGDTWVVEAPGPAPGTYFTGLNISSTGVVNIAGSWGAIMTCQLDVQESYSVNIGLNAISWFELGPDFMFAISGVTRPGTLTLTYRTDPPAVPSGFTLLQNGLWYDITATFETDNPVMMQLDYDDTQVTGPEEDLAFMHYDSTLNPPAWVNITDAVWTYDNIIEATTTSFSPFMLVEPGDATPAPDLMPGALATLHPARPNPFNPSTSLSFEIGRNQRVEMAVYDLAGRLVATLTDQVYPAGRHVLEWDGTDSRGHSVVSGVYFARMKVEGQAATSRKMMLLK
jgi:photosystem II stability/assembly factor-like uncharacterized protein